MSARKPPAKQQEGLIGYFGHTYTVFEGKRMIQYQFRIVRKMDDNRYVIQFYSFLDGCPTNLGVFTEEYLLGEDVKLYATEAKWNAAYANSSSSRYRDEDIRP